MNIEFKIIREIGKLSINEKTGWTKELNLISWNNGEPKYDIREWNDTHDKMSKGITLTLEEATVLSRILQEEV